MLCFCISFTLLQHFTNVTTYEIVRIGVFIKQEPVDESKKTVVERGREIAVAVVADLDEAVVLGDAHGGVDCAEGSVRICCSRRQARREGGVDLLCGGSAAPCTQRAEPFVVCIFVADEASRCDHAHEFVVIIAVRMSVHWICVVS